MTQIDKPIQYIIYDDDRASNKGSTTRTWPEEFKKSETQLL